VTWLSAAQEGEREKVFKQEPRSCVTIGWNQLTPEHVGIGRLGAS
jgi:hypothetical protein